MNRQSESGFTLVEVLIALVIFAIGVLAIVNMQIMSAWTNGRARGMTEGIIEAENTIERLSTLNFANDDLADRTGDGDAGLDKRTVADADHNDLTNNTYQVYWNVRDDFPFDETKFVRVYVVWNDKSVNKWFYMDTMVTRH